MGSAMRKAQRQLQREQEKRARKYNNQSSPNQVLGMKSIADYQKDGIGKMMGDQLKLEWYFEKWYEKLILVVLCAMGLWKIVGLIL